jgi:hypothetical protein
MMSDDAVPQSVAVDERSKRKTTEFCTQSQDGYRCMLVKGHGGAHEAVAKRGSLRWSSASDE